MKKRISTRQGPLPIGTYSQAVIDGNVLFLSGQIAINPISNKMIKGTIEEETIQVMENIKSILEKAQMSFNDILKVSIFMSDIKDFDKIDTIYASYFKDCKVLPAREALQVAALPKGGNVEISSIAIRS